MGTKRFEGVRFAVYSHDHEPPHVHATTPDVIMIFDLLGNGKIRLSRREDAVTPGNAKRNVKAKIRRVAKEMPTSSWHFGRRLMAHGEDLTTEADIEAAIERAQNFDNHPRVLSASYNREADAMILGLNNGTRFIIPREELAGLETATESQLSEIEINVGLYLYWPQVDVDHYFPHLLLQRTGKNPWLSPSEPQAVAA